MDIEKEIICCINNVLIVNDFKISIYDSYNKLINSYDTNNNKANIKFNSKANKIVVKTNNNYIVPNEFVIDINSIKDNKIYLNFTDTRYNKIPITITITDQCYPGLKIEKGIIFI